MSLFDAVFAYIAASKAYSGAFLIAIATFTLLVLKNLKHAGEKGEATKQTTVLVPPTNDSKDRVSGEWSPTKFSYPEFPPCLEDLSEIKPIPYRPFRWGDYHVTMGIRSMHWADWIELDCQFAHYHRIKAHRIHTRGEGVVRVLQETPGLVRSGAEAAIELVHELAEYLSRRYPTTYKITRHNTLQGSTEFGWNDAPPVKTVTLVPLSVSYELPLDITDTNALRAMEISSLLVQDDLALMIEGSDGRYYFQAGGICVPGFWRIQDKIGLPLDEIHFSGNVPQYKEKLHTSLERFFRRLPVDKPVIRNNYFVQTIRLSRDNEAPDEVKQIDPEELAWSTTTNGPEDAFEHGHGTYSAVPAKPTPDALRLRTERQTLRRLPRSGAIVFTIRTYLTPVEALGKERGIPGRLASALRSWPDDVADYKGKKRYFDVLVNYMDQCHEEQVKNGVVGPDEKLGQYPF
ncbi:hypothetical protein BDN72DRAFT_789277 [Pluteus cervinus]|uniref:Uncharacterized protein n=1 Tax=Pluteus cervinus TaxID=181527 RepID=A0ACD3B8I2_9AGAR|nr:hypothetical protein BDN72DRAFT_789277 [Pluteus cervinus]